MRIAQIFPNQILRSITDSPGIVVSRGVVQHRFYVILGALANVLCVSRRHVDLCICGFLIFDVYHVINSHL